MSRRPQDRFAADASVLREPTRPMPASLRGRLLAIPVVEGESGEIARLYQEVVREARRPRSLPEGLADRLRSVPHRARRRSFTTRWITEPRWAAAACWLLAFVLTFGTGDAVAGLLVEAPVTLHTRSMHWAQKADDWADDQADEFGEDLAQAARRIRIEGSAGYDLIHSRAVAAGAQAKAWADRRVHDLDQAWTQFATSSLAAAFSTPNEPLPQEAQDDR